MIGNAETTCITNTYCLKIINLSKCFTHISKQPMEPCCSPLWEANQDIKNEESDFQMMSLNSGAQCEPL